MNSNNIAQKWTTDRFHSYAFFASIFLKEPTLYNWLNNQAIFDNLASLKGKNILTVPDDNSTIEAKLRQDYYDCFFVPMSGKYVPPFESALRGYHQRHKPKFGHLNTAITAQVKSQYDFVGFAPHTLDIFPPLRDIQLADHIGFELAFMAYLCQCEKEARQADKQEKADEWLKFQKIFMEEHLLKWTPILAKALMEAENNIFAQTAVALELWVNIDYEDISEYKIEGGNYIEC